MGARGGGDDDRLRPIERGLDRRRGRRADLGRDLGRSGRVRVGDEHTIDPGCLAQQAGVQPPDPAGAEQRDPHDRIPVATGTQQGTR